MSLPENKGFEAARMRRPALGHLPHGIPYPLSNWNVKFTQFYSYSNSACACIWRLIYYDMIAGVS